MKLVFVTGAPKSGTTWLQTILDTHPQVSCFGEGHFAEQIILPMHAMLQAYDAKLALVATRVYEGRPPYAPLTAGEQAALIRTNVLALMRRAGPKPAAIWWGDKTPAYAGQAGMLDAVFPGCRFIDILRDPRDVAVSVLYQGHRAGMLADIRGDHPTRRRLIANAIGRWRDHQAAIVRVRALAGDRLLQIRYAELIDSTEPTLARLFAHLPGLHTPPELIHAIAEATSFRAMTGRAPGTADNTAFRRTGTTGTHTTELFAAELAFIERAVQPEQ